MRPLGATHYVIYTIQSSQVDITLSDWVTLICVCDMDKGINTDAQSFVVGLESNLFDLEIFVIIMVPMDYIMMLMN